MGASEADRTLFVGNLDPRVTEELMFELFLQAGPVIKVKIPKDKDGKTKNFAFVNFKHEESVPYAMNLLLGTKLFGRPLKIQFRSGSSHGSQNGGNVGHSPYASGNGSPTSTPPQTPNTNRFDRSTDSVASPGFTPPQMAQRAYSSPDDLQRQAVMNNVLWQQTPYTGVSGFQVSPQSNVSSPSPQQYNYYNQNAAPQMQPNRDASSSQWKNRHTAQSPQSYLPDNRHYSREQRYGDHSPDQRYGDSASENQYRRGREDYGYEDRSPESWSKDYEPRKENHRDNKYRHSRH
ncbi:RNA-binding protein 7 [Ambystoma mexicanum]|uniref:RNA-binding protein 7 n=1 Tax=Ambystoma mexicanum TaxID=8296 RepID=UPI0037E7DBF1